MPGATLAMGGSNPPALFPHISIAQSLVGVGETRFIGAEQARSISPGVEGAVENFAAVIGIEAAPIERQLVFQVSLEGAINSSVGADRLPADISRIGDDTKPVIVTGAPLARE